MRNIQLIQGLPFKVNPIQDITDTLPARFPDPEKMRSSEQITHISVHHSGVEGGTIQGYAKYHVNDLKWAHIGYHIVIKGDQLYQTNDLLTFSYHTSSNNHYTIGISVSADLTQRGMSDVERNNLYAAILTVMDIFKIPVEHILGHNEYPDNNTTCPATDMERIRNDIRTIQNQMEYAKSDENGKAVAFQIANQILYLANMVNGKMSDGVGASDGQKKWAQQMLLELSPFMKDKGLL